jgi:predicted GNAT family N-acyltransferase
MKPAFEIRVVSWSEAIAPARAVRERVFIEEQNVPRELEWDEWDEASQHAVALDEQGGCIGTARLLPDGRLGRMAVLSEWRRRGVGTALARALIERARQLGLQRLLLHAQTHAAPFYRRLGFIEQGSVFQEAGIPHVEMTRNLPREDAEP